jgi:hypothetical protein
MRAKERELNLPLSFISYDKKNHPFSSASTGNFITAYGSVIPAFSSIAPLLTDYCSLTGKLLVLFRIIRATIYEYVCLIYRL